MRRGQMPRQHVDGYTKQQLLETSGLSGKTFDTIRKAARVRGPGHGGLDWVFPVEDVIAIVHRAESGTFSERGAPAAAAWRQMLTEAGVYVPPRR